MSYHLRALSGSLVNQTDDGYVLSPLGYNVMRMIERYGTVEYRELPRQSLPDDCPFCGGTLVGRYERELVLVRCTACDGLGDDGTINYVQIPVNRRRDGERPPEDPVAIENRYDWDAIAEQAEAVYRKAIQ